MMVHKKISEDGTHWEYKTERENWQELFVVQVSGQYLRGDLGGVENLPWYLVRTEYNAQIDAYRYWAFYLWPFVVLKIGLIMAWFYPAHLIYKHFPNWIEVPQGVYPSFWWPKYLKIWTIWKKK